MWPLLDKLGQMFVTAVHIVKPSDQTMGEPGGYA